MSLRYLPFPLLPLTSPSVSHPRNESEPFLTIIISKLPNNTNISHHILDHMLLKHLNSTLPKFSSQFIQHLPFTYRIFPLYGHCFPGLGSRDICLKQFFLNSVSKTVCLKYSLSKNNLSKINLSKITRLKYTLTKTCLSNI